jgi:hypothetical protein
MVFEVLIAVVRKSSIFWNVMPCSTLKVNGRFGEYVAFRRVANKILLVTCFHSGVLLGLFFDTEVGGDMFLRNVLYLSTDYTDLYSRR